MHGSSLQRLVGPVDPLPPVAVEDWVAAVRAGVGREAVGWVGGGSGAVGLAVAGVVKGKAGAVLAGTADAIRPISNLNSEPQAPA